MKSLKVTFTLPVYWPAVGGCELHTHELVRRLAERHEVRVITLINDEKDKLSNQLWVACILRAPRKLVKLDDHGVKIFKLPVSRLEKILNMTLARIQSRKLPRAVVNGAMEMLSDFYMRKLLTLLEGSDLVHCVHGGVSFLGYATFKAAVKLGIPFVYTPLLHLYDKNWHGEKGNKATYEPELHLVPRTWTDNFWAKLCDRADALMTMTEFERKFFVDGGKAPEQIHTIAVGPLVSDEAMEDARRKYGFHEGPVVLFLGRNTPSKGVEELLSAAATVWREFPDTNFVFAGPIDHMTKSIFKRFDDQRIYALGMVSEARKASLLRACDVFCMPSREESLGVTFLEAWTFAKPIVAARIPALIELTDNGVGGFLVNPVPQDIADKICVLLRDPELRRRLGRWGKQRVAENYSWELISQRVEAVYDTVIAN